MPPLYITDLDGTLLHNDASLSPHARDTINRLVQKGIHFTVASARSIVSMRDVLAGLQLRLPVIEFNGAFISDLATGRHLVTNAMDHTILPKLQQLIENAGCIPFVMTCDAQKDKLYHGHPRHEGMTHYIGERIRMHDERLQLYNHWTDIPPEPVVCLNIVDRKERLAQLQTDIHALYPRQIASHLFINTYLPEWHWLMIHDSHASKDLAIQHLIRQCKLQKHQLIVFGDNDNDIPMFRIAQRAIAVANATNTLKPHATEIIGSNEEDAVVAYIEEDIRRRASTPEQM